MKATRQPSQQRRMRQHSERIFRGELAREAAVRIEKAALALSTGVEPLRLDSPMGRNGTLTDVVRAASTPPDEEVARLEERAQLERRLGRLSGGRTHARGHARARPTD